MRMLCRKNLVSLYGSSLIALIFRQHVNNKMTFWSILFNIIYDKMCIQLARKIQMCWHLKSGVMMSSATQSHSQSINPFIAINKEKYVPLAV